MKGPARAVEKVVTCYGGDASRMLDLCRARIIFTRVRDLARCVGLVCRECADGDVRVERLRNRFTSEHNSKLSGGFRVPPRPDGPARPAPEHHPFMTRDHVISNHSILPCRRIIIRYQYDIPASRL